MTFAWHDDTNLGIFLDDRHHQHLCLPWWPFLFLPPIHSRMPPISYRSQRFPPMLVHWFFPIGGMAVGRVEPGHIACIPGRYYAVQLSSSISMALLNRISACPGGQPRLGDAHSISRRAATQTTKLDDNNIKFIWSKFYSYILINGLKQVPTSSCEPSLADCYHLSWTVVVHDCLCKIRHHILYVGNSNWTASSYSLTGRATAVRE